MSHRLADSLFRDDRHLRGDLRRVRAAIRKGWLDASTQEHRDAIVRAFTERVDPDRIMQGGDDGDAGTLDARMRRLLAGVRLLVEMERANQRDECAAIETALGIKRRGPPRSPATGAGRQRMADARSLSEVPRHNNQHHAADQQIF